LNTTLTPHSIIPGDACFAYFNKNWGIPTGSGIGIHKLHTQLRYSGHELPEFLRSDHRRDAGKSGRGRE
jgi:hypothetical protein